MRHIPPLGALVFCIVCLFGLMAQMASAQSSQPSVVISQIYGGGGNNGAAYTHDFIELFNRSSQTVSLASWSVQYASAKGTNWQKTELTGTIQPGRYYLIEQAQGSRGTTALPTPDATGNIFISASSGKVALLDTTELLPRGTTCPSGLAVVDLVGFGRTNCYSGEGATPVLNSRTAALRAADGCRYTGQNSDDFLAGAPLPRNSVRYGAICQDGPTDRSGITVTVPIRTRTSPTPTGQIRTPSVQFLATSSPITGTFPSESPVLSTTQHVQINQIYGGGGNAGASYTHDFVELHNPGPTVVDLGGWSLQYASATGKTWLVTPLSGTISAGEFYLIQQAEGAGGSIPLPSPDGSGETAMSASSGKVALVQSVDPLAGPCPDTEAIVDFVGYGSANCYEGSGPAPRPSNTRGLLRLGEGGQDTGDNRADFVTSVPAPREMNGRNNR